MRKKFTTSGKNYGIVLGKRLEDNGEPLPELIQRLDKCLELFFDGKLDFIIVSGGKANKNAPCTESFVMKNYLLSRGVPKEVVIEENSSLTTLQNGKYCKRLLKNMSYNELYLVTSEYHFKRKYLNPRRIFKYLYRLPIKCVSA